MGFRFNKRVKIAPGIKVNVGLGGVSATVGGRGASVNIGKRGVYANAGIPGSGLSYQTKISGSASRRSQQRQEKQLERQRLQQERAEALSKVKISLDKDTGIVTFKDSSGYLIEGRDKTFVWQNQGNTILAWLEEQAEDINGDVELLSDIYLDTPHPSEEPSYSLLPFSVEQPQKPVKPTELPMPERKEIPKLGFFARLFEGKRKKHEEMIEKAEQEFSEAQRVWEKHTTYNEALYQRSIEDWQGRLSDWRLAKDAHEEAEKLKEANFSESIRRDLSLMEEVLEAELSALDWPRETLVDFQVENDGETIWIDVDLPEIEDLPQKVATVSANGRKLNIKNKAKKQLQLEYAKHIHGIALRLAGYILSTLPASKLVVVSGYSQRLNSKTGHVDDDYLYSIKFTRGCVEQFNFSDLEKLEPVDAISLFEHKRKMTATGILKAIEPFELLETRV